MNNKKKKIIEENKQNFINLIINKVLFNNKFQGYYKNNPNMISNKLNLNLGTKVPLFP